MFNLKERWNDFLTGAQRVLTVSKKPDGNQYKSMARITALGILVLGIIGFAVELVSFLIKNLL
ncbi:MAG: protein translocase SEC61 complex subunit gamma [Candidatus Diapherotrites archaeon]|nr:protein translocase SEC61 complex subunit gamma [Candidatus Diapherotrites archaeon]MDZ4256489.1 protein translocase SEC61 complex subunit gamma [archaeon]